MIGFVVAGRYELLEFLDAGTFGTVFKAVDLATEGKCYAIKVLNQPEFGSVDGMLLERELSLHSRVSGHENVVGLYDVFREDGHVFLLLELSEAGTLQDAIADDTIYDVAERDAQVKMIFLGVLDGVLHCHQKNVFHRDLKPHNILCSADGTSIHIADFGLSTDDNLTRQRQCGTTPYIPPDTINESCLPRPLSPCSQDIWALGIILVNIIARRNPWNAATTSDPCFCAYLKSPLYLHQSLGISMDVTKLLVKSWRPTRSNGCIFRRYASRSWR
ncbi:kinase-like protein [Gymnopus androsaceus JB14]|uniref:Kinase-like protein n=1 Tax=Gymnopus androsaceus JB14 TaxID=1447944 RepID=A0A6A4IGK7_9AGAR|nr:kinase-like protein [Gymnopus androsaceus JB14]